MPTPKLPLSSLISVSTRFPEGHTCAPLPDPLAPGVDAPPYVAPAPPPVGARFSTLDAIIQRSRTSSSTTLEAAVASMRYLTIASATAAISAHRSMSSSASAVLQRGSEVGSVLEASVASTGTRTAVLAAALQAPAPGTVVSATMSANISDEPPPPPPSPYPPIIGDVDFTNKNGGVYQSFPTSYSNTTFDGVGSMRFGLYAVPRDSYWMNTDSACEFLGFPGVTGCSLGWNAEGGSVDVTDGPDGALDGSLYLCGMEVEFQQEFRPLETTDLELDVLFYLDATESWGIRMTNTPSDKSLSILQDEGAVATFPVALTDGLALHTMRLELGGVIGSPDEFGVRVYWNDTLVGSEELVLSPPPVVALTTGARVRFVVKHKNGNGQTINLRHIRTTAWGG